MLTALATAGNIVFILWILYNGFSEGFKGTNVERMSYLTLVGLLALNAVLLQRGKSKS